MNFSTKRYPDHIAISVYPDIHLISSKPLVAKKFNLKPMTNKVMRNNRLKMLRQISLRFLF
ncbi:hypothetical protein [Porphyromonas cangingivalis]|uniref:hypothetical protein n=1 Tax=Porphyromonas cangingivalis TaxID=36874 RepID=UPI000414B2BF|nr:hypothetical protein [Porphyromonas cangingivalis]